MKKFLLILASICSSANAAPWEEIIPKVAEQADFILAEADRQGGADMTDADIGFDTSNTYHSHKCAVLGLMLGFPDLVAHLEVADVQEPRDLMDSAEVAALKRGGRSLQTWVNAAKVQLDSYNEMRVVVWNQHCVGQLGIDDLAYATFASGPAFEAFPTASYLEEGQEPVLLDFATNYPWIDERQVRYMLEHDGPNFAGHYLITAHHCGIQCTGYAVLDLKTGQAIRLPVGESNDHQRLIYDVNSRLVYAMHTEVFEEVCVLRAWLLEGSEFTLKSEDPFPLDDRCTDDFLRLVTD